MQYFLFFYEMAFKKTQSRLYLACSKINLEVEREKRRALLFHFRDMLLHKMNGGHIPLRSLMELSFVPARGFVVVVRVVGRGRGGRLERKGRSDDSKGRKGPGDPMESKSWHGLLQSTRNKPD